ncbi:MAG: hypothetical protein VX181_17755 [Pseudomonadota bacterium]|nr:hypothetical protein [Pseudomonadota bacterium]
MQTKNIGGAGAKERGENQQCQQRNGLLQHLAQRLKQEKGKQQRERRDQQINRHKKQSLILVS